MSLLTLVVSLFGCQEKMLVLNDSNEIQSVDFQSGDVQPGDLLTFEYTGKEKYKPTYTGRANEITFTNRDKDWIVGYRQLSELQKEIIESASGELSRSERIDLEMIVYYNLDNFVFKAPGSKTRAIAAVEQLELLQDFGRPTEMGKMIKAFLIAKDGALSSSKLGTLSTYIENRAKEIMRKPEDFHTSPEIQSYLKVEANKALSTY